MTIRRILVANRGEIATRIIRTCRELGIETVLAVSEVDRDSVPARMADRTICIGPAKASESYLKVDTILQAALGVGADAIHPGYGFLSERAPLARLCEEHGVTFIGPTGTQIEAIGDKVRARSAAQAAGVAVVPGGAVDSLAAGVALARQIGTPLLVKAVGGGGGRGLKRVDRLEDLPEAMTIAAAEASAAFGDGRLYLEQCIARARHVEVQVLGDGRGAIVHLGERDCSIQRRYQKLLEEAPAPSLSDEFRGRLHEAAVRLAKHLAYRGAGTVEFLVDVERDAYYFLEMNARIQVEHPVTEAVTGVDLVAEQIAIASGVGLRIDQAGVRWQGCAMECRVNAEDPARDFRPSPGVVTEAMWPSGAGVRVDSHIESGSRVPPYYDSLLAKVITHASNRALTLQRMQRAIADSRVVGVATNLALHAAILTDREFRAGAVDTGFIARLVGRAPVATQDIAHG